MLAALKSRQEALEETLRQRLEELKKLCLREAVSGYRRPVEICVVCVPICHHIFMKGQGGIVEQKGGKTLLTHKCWEHPLLPCAPLGPP